VCDGRVYDCGIVDDGRWKDSVNVGAYRSRSYQSCVVSWRRSLQEAINLSVHIFFNNVMIRLTQTVQEATEVDSLFIIDLFEHQLFFTFQLSA
jgi:hypothetical protein